MNYEQLANEILNRGGTPRSEPYRRGLARILKVRHQKLLGTYVAGSPAIPYPVGSAEADAYFAGTDRGHFEWNQMHESQPDLIQRITP